ncbi:MAG: hypothetical protein A2161_07730 [Candidatus Schekmanbacteria bacterium RBG_13_48_7]|uniref:LUD domain-containing protein n=1 Tax=Candidatus Schekmanbacteria bacterium RBG_13_48_7 TaxID=1817878 RepID=A0A1F7RXS3_9BACT|nr:MAG: hypothetical protein A2161_07730 [Candidatus Schekmanbacteria bacterium RBG_13_48_7]
MHEEIRKWHIDLLVGKTMEALRKNRFAAVYFDNVDGVCEYLQANIPSNVTLGLGGSVTVQELGIIPLLEKKGVHVVNPYNQDSPREQLLDQRRQSLLAEYYLTGTNAVTMDGQLVNIDGLGNRIAALAFGPKKVFVIVSTSKITSTVDEALKRIQNVAAPLNTRRLDRNTPCRDTGKCMDCSSDERICNATLILRRATLPNRITVVFVDAHLGF